MDIRQRSVLKIRICQSISFEKIVLKKIVLLWCAPLKPNCQFDEIFVTGCTEICQNDHFQGRGWRKYHQDNNILFSVAMAPPCWSEEKHVHSIVEGFVALCFVLAVLSVIGDFMPSIYQYFSSYHCRNANVLILKAMGKIDNNEPHQNLTKHESRAWFVGCTVNKPVKYIDPVRSDDKWYIE